MIAWLIGITRHRAIDATRSRQSRARARETGLDRANRSVRDSAADPMAHSTLRQIVQQALGALSPGEREVIALAYYGGLTRVEIGSNDRHCCVRPEVSPVTSHPQADERSQ